MLAQGLLVQGEDDLVADLREALAQQAAVQPVVVVARPHLDPADVRLLEAEHLVLGLGAPSRRGGCLPGRAQSSHSRKC